MDVSELFGTAARAMGVYIFILAILRLSGKRTIGNFTPFDLVAAMMLAEVTADVVFANVSLAQGAVAILAIAAAQQINAWLCYKSPTLDALLEGKPTVIVKDGKLQPAGMRSERMNDDEVLSELRLCGVDDLREVRLAIVEPDGQVSVIRQKWAQQLQKKDRIGRAASTRTRSRPSESSRRSDTARTVEDA